MVTPEDIRKLMPAAADGFDSSTLSAEESLSEAGMDSLDRASLFLAVEEKYGIKIPDDLFESLHSLRDIAGHVNTALERA